MKYLCLICADKMMEHFSPADAEKHYQDYEKFLAEIQRTGHYVGCNRLMLPETATTVRVRNGKVSTTDGPYAETKEQLGGYFVIEAKDMDEAVEWVKRCPNPMSGPSEIEIRPIEEDM